MVLGGMSEPPELQADTCPLCDSTATIRLPDWSGGRLHVDCIECGIFETNYPAVYLYQTMDENKQLTLEWLRDQIERSSELMHVTKNKYEAVTIESAKPLTKLQKKSRRRAKPMVATKSIIYYDDPEAVGTNSKDVNDDA